MAANTDPIAPLPNAAPLQVTPDITIQPPLSRRGTGPGLILIVPAELDLRGHEKTLDPPPLQKWAEESYAAAQIAVRDASTPSDLEANLAIALSALRKLPECETDEFKVAAVVVGTPVAGLLSALESHPDVKCVVFYGGSPGKEGSIKTLTHLPSNTTVSEGLANVHFYPNVGPFFVVPAHEDYRASAAGVAHTRSLKFLKNVLDGPWFDLEAIWDEHTRFEFADRSVERTMATMVQQPYVNHVPTLTGGIGRENLTGFYRDHFIFSNADDAELELVSRTVGIDRIVDEFLFNCTHDRTIDWLIPGIPPTGKKLSVPMTSIVNIRGDRLYHEHIAWDQGTVLKQLGLVPEYLPFPYPVEGGGGKKFEYRVPVAGIETAQKLVDENAVKSNGMLEFNVRETQQ